MFNMSEIKDIYTGEQRVLRGFLGSDLIFGGPSEPVMDGLGLWYDFRDSTNSSEDRDIAHDLSGRGNDGQLVNFNYTRGSGYEKSGLSFDGVDDYIDLTGNNASINMSDFTISTWTTFEENEEGVVFSNSDNKFQFSSQWGADSYMIAFINESGSFDILPLFNEVGYTPDLYKDGVFVTITVKDGDILLYLNNVLICSREGISIKAQDISLTDLGRHEPMFQQSKFNVESVNVYDRALSYEEIRHNYLYELNAKRIAAMGQQTDLKEGLLLHYDFSTKTNTDENRDIIEDLSGNGHHGELQNFAFIDGSGYQDGGLKFDGTDDYVSLESEGLQEYTISITVEIPRHPTTKGLIEGSENRYIVQRINMANNVNLDFNTNNGSVRYGMDISDSIKTNLVFAVNQFTGRVQIYKDGINVADGFVPAQENPRPFQIIGMGYQFRSEGRYVSFFPGTFYSLRQYDRQFTPEEVAELAAEEMRRYDI